MFFKLVLVAKILSSNQIPLRNQVSQWSGWSRRRLGAPLTWSCLILDMAQTPWDSGAQFGTQDQVQVPYFIKKGSDAHRGKGTFPTEVRCPPGYREIRASTKHIPRVIYRVQINGAGPRVEQCVTCTSVQGSLHIPLPQSHMSPGLP